MDAAKVKVTFRWHICDISRNLLLLAQFPDYCGRIGVVNGHHDHVCIVEIGRFEDPVDMCDLLLGYTMGDFFIQARGRAHDRNVGVGIEAVEDTACGNLLKLAPDKKGIGMGARYLATADN